MEIKKQAALKAIDRITDLLRDLSDAMGDSTEPGYDEIRAARLQLKLLESFGFDEIRVGQGNVPAAFSARWGSGKPVIGIYGEFDAHRKESGKIERTGSERGREAAHDSGNNLLCAGSIAAVYALKEYLETTGKAGTVIYYGFPAEKESAAKTFISCAGAFCEPDLMLSWRPDDRNAVAQGDGQTGLVAQYSITGKNTGKVGKMRAERAVCDAAQLMRLGLELLQKRTAANVRLHVAGQDGEERGADAAHPARTVLCAIRGDRASGVKGVYKEVNNIAKGAALMTGTEIKLRFVECGTTPLPNRTLNEVLCKNLKEVPLPELTREDLTFAQELWDSLEGDGTDRFRETCKRLSPEEAKWLRKQEVIPMCRCVVPVYEERLMNPGTLDKGDVSWTVPSGRILAATRVTGAAAHSRQAAAMNKSRIAHGSALYAGKVLAAAAIDLLNAPGTIDRAKAELEEHRRNRA